jgi:hypothetical protein
VAFSSFSNFGLLARQRTQAIPILLLVLSLPSAATFVRNERATTKRPAVGWSLPAPHAPPPPPTSDASARPGRWRGNVVGQPADPRR